MTPVATQRRSFLTTVLLRRVDLARRRNTVRSRARGMKSHAIADELGQHGLLSEAGLLIQINGVVHRRPILAFYR